MIWIPHILLHDCHWLSYIFSQTHKQIYSCPLHPVLGSQRYAIPNPAASRSTRRGEGRYWESIYISPSPRKLLHPRSSNGRDTRNTLCVWLSRTKSLPLCSGGLLWRWGMKMKGTTIQVSSRSSPGVKSLSSLYGVVISWMSDNRDLLTTTRIWQQQEVWCLFSYFIWGSLYYVQGIEREGWWENRIKKRSMAMAKGKDLSSWVGTPFRDDD